MIRIIFAHSLLLLLCSCTNLSPPPVPVETTSTIKIGGSAETYDVIKLLTTAYQDQTTDVEFDFFPPSQTSGGIQGIKSNVIDIGGVSRMITPQETGNQLTYVPLVKTPLVVVAHSSVTGVNDITSDQINAIYSGQIDNWQALGGPDEDIVLFDFVEDENEKQVLRQTYLGDDLAIVPTAIVFAEDDELLETAAITKFSMATVPYEEALKTLPLTILSIDGVSPSNQNLRSGKYAMSLPLGVVLNKEASTAAESFLDFVTGPNGKQILTDNNYIY
ncbi:MAG: substrate-binding domain-containing protein [Cyanobacteria bacterium P01_B01_bin.77]